MKDSLPTINTNFEYHSMDNEKAERMLTGPPARRARPLAFGALTVALLYFLWTANVHQLFMDCGMQAQPAGTNHAKDIVSVSDHKPIPLEAHIMSKCKFNRFAIHFSYIAPEYFFHRQLLTP